MPQPDVGDQGAQQALAVPGGSGGSVPQRRQVGGECGQAGPARQRRQRGLRGLQRVLGVGRGGELFPPGLRGAGGQSVLGLDLGEGPFGAVCLIAGGFDADLGGPAGPLVLAGHLVRCGQRERGLLGVRTASSMPATASSAACAVMLRQPEVFLPSRWERHS
jgi:hypothetical protein